MVLVAHRLSTVINADIIGVVHEGRVLEQGSHDELVQCDGVYKRLVAAQLAKRNNEIQDGDDKEKQEGGEEVGGTKALNDLFDKALAETALERRSSADSGE